MPINPTLMRLPGAFWPKTVEGTMLGSASAAPERAALLRNSRRENGWLFITSVRASIADGQADWRGASAHEPCRRLAPAGPPSLPHPCWSRTSTALVRCAPLVHPLYIWTNNVNVPALAGSVLHPEWHPV